MNQVANDKAISIKRSLRGAVHAMITRTYLISESSDTKFRLAFRNKLTALKTIITIARHRSDTWFDKNYDLIHDELRRIMSWY